MNENRGPWDVRVDYNTAVPTAPAAVDTVTQAVSQQPGVQKAWGFLIDRGTAISTGATIIVDAATPGHAVDAAIAAFKSACDKHRHIPNPIPGGCRHTSRS